MKRINIGILGAAQIAPKAIIEPAKKLENVTIFGIAARDGNRAEQFAQLHQIKHVFTDYEALIACRDIDLIYIPLPNDLHAAWIIKAAMTKKNILVEKPICLRTSEFEEIQKAVSKNGVFLLEGLMVQHHPWQKKIKEIIETKEYGNLVSVKTHITFQFNEKGSYRSIAAKGGGAFFDMGSYWIQFIQSCIGPEIQEFSGKADFTRPNGVDLTFEAYIVLPNSVRADFLCSFERPFEANHWLEFEKARLRIRNFFRAALGDHVITIDIKHMDTNKIDKLSFPPQNYYFNQLNFFLNVIKGTEENIPLSQSYDRVKIMEDIYQKAE
ncbi:MAG: Gfo/Idh/MocA family protein [Desulfobacterales bacterium]